MDKTLGGRSSPPATPSPKDNYGAKAMASSPLTTTKGVTPPSTAPPRTSHVTATPSRVKAGRYTNNSPLNETHVFIVCFSVVSHSSYDNVLNKWVPEVRHHCPHVPIIIVGTKVDLRDDKDVLNTLAGQNLGPLRREHGLKLAQKTKALCYLECSALTQKGLSTVFEEAILSVIKPRSIKYKDTAKCTII